MRVSVEVTVLVCGGRVDVTVVVEVTVGSTDRVLVEVTVSVEVDVLVTV